MIIAIGGDIFGNINQLYKNIVKAENLAGVKANWVLQTGNFGVFPDPIRADLHMRKKGALDFVDLYYQRQGVPRATVFVAGTHEDHQWLNLKKSRGELELLHNLHYLLNGYKTTIGDNNTTVSVVGLGKVFSSAAYHSDLKSKKSLAHYTQAEVERACAQGAADILLTHQAGHGERIGSFVSNSEGLSKICFATRPKLIVHSSYNISHSYTNKQGIPCLSLAFNEVILLEYINKKFSIICKI